MVAIVLVKLIEIIFGWDIGIDRLLFANKLEAEPVPNRMAPNTALTFCLVGTAIYLTSRSATRWSRAVQILTLAALLIAFLAVIGYAYNAHTFYGVLTYIPMALNTAISFLALCAGILAAQPDIGLLAIWRSRSMGGVLARRLVPAAVLAPALLGWLQVLGERAGFYDSELGTALLVVADVGLLAGMVWWTAQAIDRAEHERRLAEVALRRSEVSYRGLFENSSDSILVIDRQGRLFNASPQAERLSGYDHAELLSAHLGDLVPDLMSGLLENLSEELVIRGEYALVREDGSEVIVEVAADPIAPGLYQAILHDISEHVKAEENLRAALDRERELNDLKSRFVSMVSHEFRTPLAVIRSSADLVMNYGDQMPIAKRRERLEKIELQVTRLVQMLDEILILRKSERVGAEFNPEPLDMREFCETLIAEVQTTAPSHRIIFSSSGECAPADADPNLMRQVITNLLSNAVKYSPGRDRVMVDLVCGETEIVLRVSDEGIGIPEEDQEHLFEMFHRARNVAGISGTGLGLPIVKQAVDAHHGSIQMVSELNIGTTFTIHLPRLRPA